MHVLHTPVLFPVWSPDCGSLAPPVGSKSDGQKSPSDSVFLRMDNTPYIRDTRVERKEETGGWTEGLFLKPNYLILCTNIQCLPQ